jgi:glycine cleavage system T protein
VSNPLVLHHEKLGAQLESGTIPLQFTNSSDEYWTVRNTAGFADISHLGLLSVTGKDRISFLNGLLTNDISKVSENGGVHTVLLNTKARVLADLYLYGEEDQLLADTGEAPAVKVKDILDRFIITEDVQLYDSSDDLVHITVQGPKSAQALKEIIGLDIQDLKPLEHKTLGPSRIIARDRTGQTGYDIILPRDESEAVWQAFLLKGGDLGLRPIGLRALDILRLEAGLPKYGVDVDENTIVLEAGYRDAISFTKGCYMGQEVVARATHIGRVNKQLVKIEFDAKDAPAKGSKLFSDGRDAGFLTSAAFSPGLGKIVGLAYASRDFAKEGTRLSLESGSTMLPAVVVRTV